jgi:FKBP-type peptidyl-prolyl cis-trans isomerase
MHASIKLSAVACAVACAVALASACATNEKPAAQGQQPVAAAAPAAPAAPAAAGASRTTPSGLQIQDVVIGQGTEAVAGQNAKVHYTGWLIQNGQRGAKFDSSVDRGQPFVFPLGAGRVIKGWDEGVQGMKVGGKRVLLIPPELAYGARGAGGIIPPNSTLMFEVDYLGTQ